MEWEVNKGNPDSERRQLNRILDEIQGAITGGGGQVDSVVAGVGIDVDASDPVNPEVALDAGSQASLALADSSVQPGDNVSVLVNNSGYLTDAPSDGDTYGRKDGAWEQIVSGGGQVDSVVAGTGIDVDATDPVNPEVSLDAATIASLALADTSTQPGDNISTLTNDSGYTTNTGTVTSVGLTVPTGLSVAGSPVTTSGTFTVTYAAGYGIPTTVKQGEWDTAYADRMKWDGGSTGLVAATGRSSLGGTTVGQNIFTVTDPGAIRFIRINADNSVTLLSDSAFRTAIGAGTSSTTGTVTSVDLANSTGLTASGGPITTSGSLTYTLSANLQAWHGLATSAKQDALGLTANTFYARSSAGAAANKTITDFGLSLVDDADNTAARTTLGLGTAATQNTGTSGANLPFANGTNTWANTQTFTVAPVFTDQSGTRTALGLGTAATQNTGTSGANLPFANGNNTYSGSNTHSGNNTFTGSVAVGGTRTAAVTNSIAINPTIDSTVTTSYTGITTALTSTATAFNTTDIHHFLAQNWTPGAGHTISNQYGFRVGAIDDATTNIAFSGAIASGNGWNLHMPGTAPNYLAGQLRIGNTADIGGVLQVTGASTFTGAITGTTAAAGTNSTVMASTAYAVSAAPNSSYRILYDRAASHIAGRTTGTYAIGWGDAAPISGTGTLYPWGVFYLDPADYPTINGLTTKLRVRGQVVVNDTAPAATFVIALHPVTHTGATGGAGLNLFTISAAVASSAATTITTPAADSLNTAVGSDFAIPAAGWYCLGFVQSGGAVAASSHLHISAQLQMRNT